MEFKYKCKSCTTEFNIVASFTSLPGMIIYCPVCNSDNLKRIYDVPAITFKGKGFYKNDSRDNK